MEGKKVFVIGNKNTKVYHELDCPAIGMMSSSSETTDISDKRMCAWCARRHRSKPKENKGFDMDTLFCNDPYFIWLFNEYHKIEKCSCGHIAGNIYMYEDKNGENVQGHEGKYWVYFECASCLYALASWKAEHKVKMRYGREPRQVFRERNTKNEVSAVI